VTAGSGKHAPRHGALPKGAFEFAYGLLRDLTPLPTDCGELCGAVCCRGSEEHSGMYLFPGEECMFSGREDWLRFERHLVSERVFCPQWDGKIEAVTFVVCDGTCPRPRRPLACRLFPMAPRFAGPDAEASRVETTPPGNGAQVPPFEVILDPDAAFICPLARYGRLTQLDPAYVAACGEVFSLLASDPLILADFRWRCARWLAEAKQPWRRLL